MAIRTDLAQEAHALAQEAGRTSALPGVEARSWSEAGTALTLVKVLSQEGERAIGKPRGSYLSLALDAVRRGDRTARDEAQRLLCRKLEELTGLAPGQSVLLAGLGNRRATPDALGSLTAERVLVTRHLTSQYPDAFPGLRQVSVLQPGVLGATGVESAELVHGAVETVRPDALFVVDALAAASPERLFFTIQLSDAGIVPGSGIGNARAELSQRTLGIPVYSLGVPTVIDAAALTGEDRPELRGMVVTGKDVDAAVQRCAGILSGALNRFLQPTLTEQELAWMLELQIM